MWYRATLSYLVPRQLANSPPWPPTPTSIIQPI